MVLVKRTKTWANPDSAAADESHENSNDVLYETKELKDEVQRLKMKKVSHSAL